MAILPVCTTSKLHAARINLRQTPSSVNTWGIVQLRKRVWFWPEVGVVCKKFHARKRARPYEPPHHEILDLPLTKRFELKVWRDRRYGQLLTYCTAHCRSRYEVIRTFTRVLKRKWTTKTAGRARNLRE